MPQPKTKNPSAKKLTYDDGYQAGMEDFNQCQIPKPYDKIRPYARKPFEKGYLAGHIAAYRKSRKSQK